MKWLANLGSGSLTKKKSSIPNRFLIIWYLSICVCQLGVDKYEVSKAELNDPLRKIKTEISSLLLSQKDYVTARQVLLLYE